MDSHEILQRNARRLAADTARETPESLVQEVGSRVAPPPIVDETKERKIQMKRLQPGSTYGDKPVNEIVRWQPHENVAPRQPAGRSVYEYEENSHNNSITASMCINIARLQTTDEEYRKKVNRKGETAPPGFNGARKEIINELKEFNRLDHTMEETYGNTVASGDVVEAIWDLSETTFMVAQYGLTWPAALNLVWNRIRSYRKNRGLKKMLHEAILECKKGGEIPCESGKINRLVMVLVGTFDDMKVQMSESEVISGIILMVKRQYPNYLTDDTEAKLLYKDLRKRLDERGVAKETQKEWISHLWPEPEPDDDDDVPNVQSSSRTSSSRTGSSRSSRSSRQPDPVPARVAESSKRLQRRR